MKIYFTHNKESSVHNIHNIRSPADYMAEWENVPLETETKKKHQVD